MYMPFFRWRVIFAILIFCSTHAGAQEVAAQQEIEEHRRLQELDFIDKEKSPLLPKERKKFKGLNYYPVDLSYRVSATFVRTAGEPLFKMKTTTSRLPDYVKYGEVRFELEGRPLKLAVYQSPDLMKMEGYEDYLFIPFTDPTNGQETYEVGRYLEFRIPESEDVIIDFNKCYNPYCSYNPNYSCPIPPEENNLPIEIRAGEKKYH